MGVRVVVNMLLLTVVYACAREGWPDPPRVDPAAYQEEYEDWRAEQESTAAFALPLIGIWPLDEGETPFGTDPSLPIVLPVQAGIGRAGALVRTGDAVTLTPAANARLHLPDGTPVTMPIGMEPGTSVKAGTIRLDVVNAGPQIFLGATDEDHPALQDLRIETYPVDGRWRVAARFEAFETPRVVPIGSTRGISMDMPAAGELVFRIDGRESRLLALGEPGDDSFFVMFKDATNGVTTYGGYRIVSPPAVEDGGWTVLDFNRAGNPPCAYSPYTICPLPPRENRIDTAIEAGMKRHPLVRGFAG